LDDDQDGGSVNVSSGTGSPGQSQTKGHKTVVVLPPLVLGTFEVVWHKFFASQYSVVKTVICGIFR